MPLILTLRSIGFTADFGASDQEMEFSKEVYRNLS